MHQLILIAKPFVGNPVLLMQVPLLQYNHSIKIINLPCKISNLPGLLMLVEAKKSRLWDLSSLPRTSPPTHTHPYTTHCFPQQFVEASQYLII